MGLRMGGICIVAALLDTGITCWIPMLCQTCKSKKKKKRKKKNHNESEPRFHQFDFLESRLLYARALNISLLAADHSLQLMHMRRRLRLGAMPVPQGTPLERRDVEGIRALGTEGNRGRRSRR